LRNAVFVYKLNDAAFLFILAFQNFIMPHPRILALSSSRVGNSGYLQKAVPYIKNFLGNHLLNVAFIPFAGVEKDYKEYANMVTDGLKNLPYKIEVVQNENANSVIEACDVIMVGGGNTFKLLHDIYNAELIDLIREKVNSGTCYIGWSAGSNITGLTIGTTNDMPIIEPRSFKALGFFPFQINPHYLNQSLEGHNGETRDQRLTEFLKVNPGISIVGLPEGTALSLENGKLKFVGECSGVLFESDANDGSAIKREVMIDEDLSFLLI
jgi:dipeptidase E